jgi:hypothetical protein
MDGELIHALEDAHATDAKLATGAEEPRPHVDVRA